MSVSGAPNSNANNSSNDDVEDKTYMPSPRTRPQRKGLASASGSGLARDEEIEEEDDGVDGEGEKETFDVEEINPPIFRQPLNPNWRAKVSYKGKIGLVRVKRKENPRLQAREASDYRFHTFFQQDLYESVIITKGKPVAISQWIDWSNMENKDDRIFDDIMAACRAKHLRDVMAYRKNWNNEVIA
jgi:hypothetical protein